MKKEIAKDLAVEHIGIVIEQKINLIMYNFLRAHFSDAGATFSIHVTFSSQHDPIAKIDLDTISPLMPDSKTGQGG